MKYVFISAFLILAIIQWMIPARIILAKDRVVLRGEPFKFRTEPVDPYNPFKGKYITLNFSENSFTDTVQRKFVGNDEVYVILARDSKGFATVKNLSDSEPANTNSYVKARVSYVTTVRDSITVHFSYPFSEFYMDEYKAPKAENIYLESARDSSNITYALVKILNGDAVIENVFINNIPIGALIK